MTLSQLNQLNPMQRRTELGRCCGSTEWIKRMMEIFPVQDEGALQREAERTWFACDENDWREAFTHHPKIGDISSLKEKFAATAKWAGEEQSAVRQTADSVLQALKDGNMEYENRFGYIFIVCASDKSAGEMLALLQARLHNNASDEIQIAMREQNKITLLRLQKLLSA